MKKPLRELTIRGNRMFLTLYTDKKIIESVDQLLWETAEMIASKLEEESEDERWETYTDWARDLQRVGIPTFGEKDDLIDFPCGVINEALTEIYNQGWMFEETPRFPMKLEPLGEEDQDILDELTAGELLSYMAPAPESW